MRSVFIAMVFSFLALGCGNNQFVPANETTAASLEIDTDGAESMTLAEDGEYEIITPESLSSGGKQAQIEKAKKQNTPTIRESIPPEAFDDPDFGTPKSGRKPEVKKPETIAAETPHEGEAPKSPEAPKAPETPKSPETPKAPAAPRVEDDWAVIPDDEQPTYPVPGSEVEDEDAELPTEEVLNDKDISLTGRLRPTVYYYPVINEDKRKCEKDYILRDDEGEKMISLCEKTRASCRLQGSCAIIQNGKKRTFNIIGNFKGKDHFFETSKDVCRFGFGVKASCLDPFYTVAADLSIYRPGDVIYVPIVRGVLLPDGTKHSGYFVVRDSGRNILGKTRFDFFTGHISWRDDANPFSNIGLSNKANKFKFMKIKGAKAKAILAERNYPKLPAVTVKH